MPWDIDRKANTVSLRTPKSQVHPLEFPARPMLGCIGVAPAGDFAPTSGPSGSYGGNLDYNKIGEGPPSTCPSTTRAGCCFWATATPFRPMASRPARESRRRWTSSSSSSRRRSEAHRPAGRNSNEIISIGSQPEFAARSDNGLKMATSDMVDWLTKDYAMEPWAAHLLIGYQASYDVVTVAGSMAVCLAKTSLPKSTPAPR